MSQTPPAPTKPNDGGPAFPFACKGPTTAPEIYYGMSLRDWLAGNERLEENEIITWGLLEALAGPRPSGDMNNNPLAWFHWDNKWRAAMRYARADAMIAVKEGK